MEKFVMLLFTYCTCLFGVSSAVELGDLYPYGTLEGDHRYGWRNFLMKTCVAIADSYKAVRSKKHLTFLSFRLPPDQEDVSSHEIRLRTPVKFYSNVYDTIFVSYDFYVSTTWFIQAPLNKVKQNTIFFCLSGEWKWSCIVCHRDPLIL